MLKIVVMATANRRCHEISLKTQVAPNTAGDFRLVFKNICFFVATNAAQNCTEVSSKLSSIVTLTNVETWYC